MTKKYGYQIDFLSREVSPSEVKCVSASGECLLKEMKKFFEDYLKQNGLSKKGTSKSGSVLNAKGQTIGSFKFTSNEIN